MKDLKKKVSGLKQKENLEQHQIMVKILDKEELPYSISVNPICATKAINVEINKIVENVQYKLYGCGGQQLLRNSVLYSNTIVTLDEFDVNTFLLIISENGREVCSYEIVK